MSMYVACPHCGERMEVPAFEGDGVFSKHECRRRDDWDLSRTFGKDGALMRGVGIPPERKK